LYKSDLPLRSLLLGLPTIAWNTATRKMMAVLMLDKVAAFNNHPLAINTSFAISARILHCSSCSCSSFA